MPTEFSSQLIERTRRHFLNHFKKEITVQQADQYLHSFAELFGLFWDNDEEPPDHVNPPP